MALLIQRVALGGLCAALHLASTHAFVPSTSPSSAATRKPLSASSRLAAVDVRGAARSAGGKAGMAMSAGEHDLFIVGAGYLGKIIGAAWNLEHPEAKNVGETRSYTRHGDFMPPGMRHVRRKDRAAMVEEGIKYPNVVFCANPGGNSDYALEVYRAMQEVWDGTGMFVFTSSGSVYAERKGGVVTEASQIDPAKVDAPLRIAEKVTVQGGGCVVRLAGLYSVQRGPHSVWLNEKRLNHHSKGEINLISYQDAGLAVVAALNAGLAQVRGDEGAREIKGEIFLAADEHPMTRRRICELALAHPLYGRKKMPKFTGDATPPEFVDTGPTKVYDTSWTREMLGWEPKCSSMEEYFTMEREVSLEGRRRAV